MRSVFGRHQCRQYTVSEPLPGLRSTQGQVLLFMTQVIISTKVVNVDASRRERMASKKKKKKKTVRCFVQLLQPKKEFSSIALFNSVQPVVSCRSGCVHPMTSAETTPLSNRRLTVIVRRFNNSTPPFIAFAACHLVGD